MAALTLLMFLTLTIPCLCLEPQEQQVSYWRQTYPNATIPSIVKKRLSPLTATQSEHLQHLIETNTLSDQLPDFCKAANLVCSNKELAGKTNFYGYVYIPKGNHRNKSEAARKYFRENTMKDGTLFNMPNMRPSYPPRSFLPHSIASKLPMEYASLRSMFQATNDMDRLISEAVEVCRGPPVIGEKKTCATSLQELVNFPLAIYGQSSLSAFATESANGSSSSVMVSNVHPLLKEDNSKMTVVSCHELFLPYMVMFCHSFDSIQIYEATLIDPNTRAINNERVFSICHRDTSNWDSRHEAFAALKGKPGQFEICHWMPPTNLVWAPSSI